jgi:DNA-binding MarR family transcriptional regulator
MRWLSADEQAVWRLLLAVECRVREKLDEDLRTAHDLTLGDYDVLVQLAEAEGGSLRMSDLADRVLLSRSGLTRRLDGLVREGLVARRTCPEDRRGAFADITTAGRRRLEQAAPTHVEGVRRYVIAPAGDLGGLAAGLLRMEDALATRAGPRAARPVPGPGSQETSAALPGSSRPDRGLSRDRDPSRTSPRD